MSEIWPPNEISLSKGKRVLFLTKNLELIRRQLYEGLELKMDDVQRLRQSTHPCEFEMYYSL